MSSSAHARPRANGLDDFATYGIDPDTGFVPSVDPLTRLPETFEPWEAIVPSLAPLIRTRRIRAHLKALPLLETGPLVTEAERERALLILGVFANAWVWGGERPDLTLPAPIAVPLCALADALDRPAIAHYGSMALRNWSRIDPSQPISPDNLRTQIGFLGGVDEEWFFIASLGVELQGAPLLRALYEATLASCEDNDTALAQALNRIADGMIPVMAALECMRQWCDPHVFYHRVRTYLAGWPAPGVVYEGVSEQPRSYFGGSAGQSSLIQAIDAALGVVHDGETTGPYFAEMRRYMPRDHRRFVVDLARNSRVKSRADQAGPMLQTAYNHAIKQVSRFRAAHRRIAHDYISLPSGMASGELGTGGTTYVEFLKDAHWETSRNAI